MKQIEVTILGQSYVLGCPDDGEAALLEAVASVDREMSAIRDAGRVKAREKIAVLAALNLAYRLAELKAAPSVASAKPGDAKPTSDAPPMDTSTIDLGGLIQRIDRVLAHEGRLI